MRVSSGDTGVKDRPLIALTTDFGLDDVYVGVMKAVILNICPEARLLDLTHGIPPQDVLAGCLALEAARPFLPPGTIHLAVVDPGVGTDRPAIAVRTERDAFVGPDNGLFSFLAPTEIQDARKLENQHFLLQARSATFHGRDVFAPVAAHLARGVDWTQLGSPTTHLHRVLPPRPSLAHGSLTGEVLAFDHFGNALTSIRASDLPPAVCRVQVGGRDVPLVTSYASVPPGEALALVGSSGRLEIAVRDGDAHRALRLVRGAMVVVGT
jgi:S-adenosylmethionine hydrolase